jgi:hypothetical protein
VPIVKVPKEDILKMLEPLFIQANKEKKWFYCGYQGMCFSPKELREKHKNGELIWGPVNWKLIEPPRFKDIDAEIKKMRDENYELANRIATGWESAYDIKDKNFIPF